MPSARPRLAASRTTVLVAAGALLLAVLATLAGLAWYERGEVLERAAERNELMARVLAEQATRHVEAAALATATAAELLQRGMPPQGAEVQAAMRQSLQNLPFLRAMAVLDAGGRVWASAGSGDLAGSIDPTALGPLPAPGHEALGPYVPASGLRELQRGVAATEPAAARAGFLPLLRGVAGGGAREPLVVVALLDPAAFADYQQLTLNDPRAAAALLSSGGQLIAATGAPSRAPGSSLAALPPFTQFLPQRVQGEWIGAGLRDGTQIAAFRSSATRPLVLLVEFGQADAMADWARRARGLAGAALAALLLVGAMTAIAARSVNAREAARVERDHALAALARRGRELNVTIQSLQELVFRTDAGGHITFSNQRFTVLAGREVNGRCLWDLVAPEQREAARALFADQSALDARRLQATLQGPDGAARRFDIAVMPLHEAGRIIGFAGSAVDVSERVLAQQRAQGQLAFTRLLMEVSPLPCTVMDLQRRCVLVNRAWEDMTGLPRADVIGRPANAHLSEAERELHAMHDARLLQHGQPLRFEAVVTHRDGTPRDVVVDKLLLPGDEGQPAGVLSVMIDVTEFRNAERATRQARDAAEEASRAKTEFIANISHELRTPLQSIIGFSELGIARARDQAKLAGMFKDIHDAGQRMLALVNDLLDVAKIESTVGTIHLERCDLRGLVREVLDELRPQLARQGVQVALQLPEAPLRGKVDPLRLQQVLRNVLANAIKFSPAGGLLTVTGEHTAADELHLSVADQGPGIPPAELESIFEAFVQSSQTKDGSGGTGLGLAICRSIIAAHGGRIQAENRSGGGAVFHIHLPARGTGETLPLPL